MAYEYKEGDNRPVIEYPAEEKDGEPVDAEAADAIEFYMAAEDGTLKVDGDTSNTGLADEQNEQDDGTSVKNILTWSPDDADTDTPGNYEAEFQLIYNQGQADEYSRTFPADVSDNIEIRVDPALK